MPLSPKLLELGEAIRRRRQELGLTLKEAGRDACSHAHLSKLERGLEWPSIQVVVALEQALGVPPGTYLARLDAAQPERWPRQRDYRGAAAWWAEPRSVADTYTRHFLCQPGKPALLLVPKVRAEYAEPVAPPYRILHQSIEYVVDRQQRSTRTFVAYRIEAVITGVDHFSFTRSHPLGRFVERVDLTIGPGAELAEVSRHSARHLRYRLRLKRPLEAGHPQTVAFSTRLHGISVPVTAHANTIDRDSYPVDMSVVFATDLPSEVWWFVDLPFDAVPGLASLGRLLVPDRDGRVSRSFSQQQARLAHGFGWSW